MSFSFAGLGGGGGGISLIDLVFRDGGGFGGMGGSRSIDGIALISSFGGVGGGSCFSFFFWAKVIEQIKIAATTNILLFIN